SLESAFWAPLTLKFRCVDGYGWPLENSPVETTLLFGWMTCRMLLSSKGPPLRTTTTCPPSALVRPARNEMPGTTPTSTTTRATTAAISSRPPRRRFGGPPSEGTSVFLLCREVVTSRGLYERRGSESR